nr:chymotrypsin-2-like [Onthophagus taurus]
MYISNKRFRIIEGGPADQRNFPFIVSIIYNGYHTCGASLITSRYVLTAAHCAYSRHQLIDERYTFISVGSSRWEEGTKYGVSKIYVHDEYNNDRVVNDIALLKTDKKVRFSTYIRPGKLYGNELPKQSGLECIVIGWGYTSNNGYLVKSATDVLNKVKITTISPQRCRRYYRNVDERNICLTGIGRQGSCSGDSGGPLLTDIDGNLVQIGLVSYGGDCNNTAPEVYTKISYFKDWILNSVKLLDAN